MAPSDLVQAANYLTSEFAGLPLDEVRDAVLERIEQERMLYDELFGRAMRLARQTLEDLPTRQAFHVEGVAALLDGSTQDAVSLPTLRALVEMMEEKEQMVHLLTQYIDGPGLTIVIGAEHAAPDLRPFSLIASTAVDGTTQRTVGLIGPLRMHYSRAIALVDGTTQAVTRVLRSVN
jgi:heat-inducible transcriptional repressor